MFIDLVAAEMSRSLRFRKKFRKNFRKKFRKNFRKKFRNCLAPATLRLLEWCRYQRKVDGHFEHSH